LLSIVSLPWLVPSARQVARAIELRTNWTWPSQKTTFTPPPACRLRAADIFGNSWVLSVVHGVFQVAATLQLPPVITSGAFALGRLNVVNPLALPHQMNPRRSPP